MNITQTIFMLKQFRFNSTIKINLEFIHKQFFNKKIILYLIGIPLLVVIKTPIEKFISKNLVTPILSNIQSEWPFDAFIIAIALCIILLTILRFRKYTASKEFFFLEILILSAYLYYRLSGTAWTFTPFKLIDSIKYADLLIIGVFCQLVLVIPYKRVKPKNEPGSLFEDNPLGENGDDILGYSSYAKLLGGKIRNSHFEKAFAIGINGKWGLGKTSFIDLLKRTVQGNDIIEINFDPWNSQSPLAIIQDFFDSFNEKVRPYHSSITRLSNEYATKLVQLKSNTLTRSIQLITSSITNNKPTNSLYKQINTALEKINKKVVIYIDDLDRLDSHEIVEVLRLIRNTANFYNTTFVVAYDRNYIVNALKDHTSFGEIEFLEKIFQIEITLPKFNKEILRNELAEKLKKNFPKANLETIIGSATSKPLLLDSWLETLRDVTRLANSITINYSKLVDEVLFSELLFIEILRLKYPSVYELLKQHKSDFFCSKYDQSTGKSYSVLTMRKIKDIEPKLDNNEELSLEEYLNKNPEKHSIQKDAIPKVIDLLSTLFPDITHFSLNKRDQLSIVNPLKYDRYFEYGLSQGNLSENEFKQVRTLDQNELHDKISEWVNKGLASEIRNRFYDITIFDNKEDFEKIIRAIFYLASQPNGNKKRKSENIVNFDSENLLKKLDNYEDSIVKKYYSEKDGKNQLEIYIKSLFLNAPSPYTFEAKILKDINMSFPRTTYITEELSREFPIVYLNKYCNEISKFDSHIWYLFHRCKYRVYQDTGNGSHNRSDVTPEKAKEIVQFFVVHKDLDGFLEAIIDTNGFDKGTYGISTMVEVIFNGWLNFEKELNRKDESQYQNLKEFNQFYKKHAESNHSQAIAFEFKNISVKD